MSEIKIFERALEDVLLNKTELNNLKSIIKDVASGKGSDKFLREQIIKNRINIIKDLLKLFPFFTTSVRDTNKISMPINTLQEELQEKNAFLEQVGQRINNIYNRLKKQDHTAP
ncbi:MAG: hypothetical protein WBH31_09140 [Promethearchaeia archaeon]